MSTFQGVTKNSKKIHSFFSNTVKIYVASLLLSTGKKNCSAMSSELNLSYHSIYTYFDDFAAQEEGIKAFFANVVHRYATKENPGVLIVDSSQLIKQYSKKLDNVCYDLNNSMKLVFRGLSCVATAWTNGKVLIPLDFDFWMRKKDLEDDSTYRKKTEISRDLIVKWQNKIPFGYVALDGDYASESFLRFLHENNLKFSIRMPKNRTVEIDGVCTQLKKQKAFKLIKNERYKTKKGTYKGIPAYFTSHKRKGNNGTKQVVFVVSNLEKLTPKQHILAYELRWPIEKLFRTSKQHLGIQHCQSTSSKKQRAHIFATFAAFTELEIRKISKQKKSPEQVLKEIRPKIKVKKNPLLVLGEGFIT